jgi:hypothetical protein
MGERLFIFVLIATVWLISGQESKFCDQQLAGSKIWFCFLVMSAIGSPGPRALLAAPCFSHVWWQFCVFFGKEMINFVVSLVAFWAFYFPGKSWYFGAGVNNTSRCLLSVACYLDQWFINWFLMDRLWATSRSTRRFWANYEVGFLRLLPFWV